MNQQMINPNQNTKSPNISTRSGESGAIVGQPSPNQNNLIQNPNQSTGPMTLQVIPAGLDKLLGLDQVLIKQKVNLLEALTGCERKNEYKIENTAGQLLYEAKEVSGCCDRLFCAKYRPFDMEIRDIQNNLEVLRFGRPFRCDSCLCFCCLQEMDVQIRGQVVGQVKQDCSIIFPVLHVEDNQKQIIFRIEGPCLTCSLCCNDVIFDIFTAQNRTKVGQIAKNWSGCCRETFTDSDFFKITFPIDLDVNMKAILLGSAFLIDFMFFEE